jgi:hypothetical protein
MSLCLRIIAFAGVGANPPPSQGRVEVILDN